MRLYHSRFLFHQASSTRRERRGSSNVIEKGFFMLLLILLAAGCNAPRVTQAEVNVSIYADGSAIQVELQPGSTVQEALARAGVTIGSLDRSEPPLYTILADGAEVHIVRVREEFHVEEVVIPFAHQVWRNEALPENETRLVQPGVNGLQEITYRRVIEDGKEISNSPVKSVLVKEAVPEIMVVGGQAPFASVPIPGRLVYLLGGNAWLIEGATTNRRPVVTSGDLDGRIFSLSPDGKWLLFTRRSIEEDEINTLWAVNLDEEPGAEIVDLQVSNVVHFADWKPGSTYTIAYSTVEPRPSAPGWQANNDLNLLNLSRGGQVRVLPSELETNMGGTYGWWGMTFQWSPDGSSMAYARPDSIGLVEIGEGSLDVFMEIIPLETRSDWAWVPGLKWGADSKTIFTVDHPASSAAPSPEESPLFDLVALPLEGGGPLFMTSQAGMFTYPLPSPLQPKASGEEGYQVAYLQAIFPTQSDSSRYHVVVMDRDGSNRRVIFPTEGGPGINPQSEWGAWSPGRLEDTGSHALALLYQDNLWIVDTVDGSARQVTGDGLVSRVDWK